MNNGMEPSILIIDDEKDIREIISIILESSFSFSLLFAKSGNEGVNQLKKYGDKIKFIICDFNMNDGKGDLVYNYLLEQEMVIPFALITATSLDKCGSLGKFLSDNRKNYYFPKPFNIDEIIDSIKSCVEMNPPDDEKNYNFHPKSPDRDESLYRIKKEYSSFLPQNEAIYIRLSDKKIVKISDNFENDIVEKYKLSELKDFYVSEKSFNSAIYSLINENYQKAQSLDDVNEKHLVHIDSIKNISELIRKIGIIPSTEKIVLKVLDQVFEDIESGTKLKVLFEIFKGKEHYIQEQALLTAFICTHVLKRKDWFQESILKKIILASLFQNLSLENCEHAQVYTDKDFKSLKTNEKEQISSHMKKAVVSLSNLNEKSVDEDTLNMILHHHDSNDSFHTSHSNLDRPLVSMFNFSARFSHMVLMKDQEDFSEILKEMVGIYREGGLNKTFDEFKKCFDWYEES